MSQKKELVLFGGDKPWKASDWTASDDRVRGGKSESFLELSGPSVRFRGNLDIKTLGGAGFASQRTTSEGSTWDVSSYDGILLDLGKSDGKRYTFILKDDLLPRNPGNGREQATISWEYDFVASEGAAQAENSFVFMPWAKLKPTYRGKEKKGVKQLDTENVKRFSIMMRSFFGEQQGDFTLTINSIKAVTRSEDLENGSAEGRKKAVRGTRLTLSLFGITLFACGLWAYVCPWLKEFHIKKRWG